MNDEFLEEGFMYSIDGDLIDKRTDLLRSAKRKNKAYKQQEIKERKLREEYPALQDAWEKYQIILRTVENA